MLSIQDLIPRGCVLVTPETLTKETLIRRMVDTLASAGKVQDPDTLYRDIVARETLVATGVGSGCAIPHAHSQGVAESVIAAAVLSSGVDFGGPDGIPARLVFLMAGPKGEEAHHLKLLAKIARILHNTECSQSLMDATSEDDFRNILACRES